MATLELSVPSAETVTNGKTYTVYNILLRLPLRSFTIQKRYSDFDALNKTLTTLAGAPPPTPLPPKSLLTRTVNNPHLTEERRKGLEHYLRAILQNPDSKWRETPAFRQFLNLPSSWSSAVLGSSSSAIPPSGVLSGTNNAPIVDSTLWLDSHRELKELLHEARLYINKKQEAITPHDQHEASAGAKKCLIKAGGILMNLQRGLKEISDPNGKKPSEWIGEGELRRRRDLLAAARTERDALESLSSATSKRMTAASTNTAASAGEKSALFGGARKQGGGRVLGGPIPETDRTRELDNQGVLQLQQTMMQEQDEDLDVLLNLVRKQKTIGLAIGEEVAIQNEMLKKLDEDVDRNERKMKIAKNKINKIS